MATKLSAASDTQSMRTVKKFAQKTTHAPTTVRRQAFLAVDQGLAKGASNCTGATVANGGHVWRRCADTSLRRELASAASAD